MTVRQYLRDVRAELRTTPWWGRVLILGLVLGTIVVAVWIVAAALHAWGVV